MVFRKSGLLRKLKRALMPAGRKPRAVLTGPFRGIVLDLDLQGESQMYSGLFERELHPSIRRFAKGARSVVDIGTAEGEYTLFALLKTAAERVIAFEPDPVATSKLRRNLQLNGVEENRRLEFHNKFLGTEDGPDMVSMETLAERILTPCFLKMDIEGAEAQVLRASASGLLAKPGLRWLIEAHSIELRKECTSILTEAGYRVACIPQAWWRAVAPELRGVEVTWLTATK